MRIRFHLRFIVLLGLAASWLPLHAQQAAEITVNAGQVLGPVNRLIFGQNIEAADNARIFSRDTTDLNLIQRGEGFWDPTQGVPVPEVLNQSRAIGMSMLRYPGGCLAHNFDWRKTVGPDAKRSGWLFGLREYLSLCSSIGAVPLITVSDYALPAEEMPQNAADLVEYLNSPADARHPWAMKRMEWGHPAPYNVTWFELGNESMHGNHRVLPRRQYSAEQYAAYANATAAAMRKVDPNIKLGIVMTPGPGNDVNSDWNRTVMHLAGASADFVVIHMYAPQEISSGIPESLRIQAMMAVSQQVDDHLGEYHQMIRKELGHDLPLGITEFNGALDDAAHRFSYGNALECADLLRVFLKPEANVALANYFNFLNGAFGMMRSNVSAATGEPISREPALPLFQLWAKHFGSRLVKVEVQGPRAEFPGAGSVVAATGTTSEPRRKIERVDLDRYSSLAGSLWPKLLNVQVQKQNTDVTIHLQKLSRSIYPTIAEIPRPEAAAGTQVEFSISFDAQFTPDPGSTPAPLGIGLMDSRGWKQTHSGIGVDGITTQWKHFDETYRLTAQTPSVDLTARLMADGTIVSGVLQIHHLEVTSFAAAHEAAYPLLTSSASTSADGKKLYLMVFNKSATDAFSATTHLNGFSASKAQYWEVNGPAPDSTSGVGETRQASPLPISNRTASKHVFPAHSMTAIEFDTGRVELSVLPSPEDYRR